MGLIRLSCIFNLAILCEHNSSEVVDPTVFIFGGMIDNNDHVIWREIAFSNFLSKMVYSLSAG
jgi:hypothetical protein